MRVLVAGATGNVGSSLVTRLVGDPTVEEVIGVARRTPSQAWPKVRWVRADIGTDDLDVLLTDVDAVVHVAWLIQPSHDRRQLWRTNVAGTARLLATVERAGTPVLLYASSVGTYSPRVDDDPVDETWPTGGIPELPYSRHKAYVETLLDKFELLNPDRRVARMRPALIFRASAARHIRNLFLGRHFPGRAVPPHTARRLLGHSPVPFQVVHTDDVADAFHRALRSEASGAFNLAAGPPIGRRRPVTDAFVTAAHGAVAAGWHLRALPLDPAWITLASSAPTMSTDRARTVLGWQPTHSPQSTLDELLAGLHRNTAGPTPVLQGVPPPDA